MCVHADVQGAQSKRARVPRHVTVQASCRFSTTRDSSNHYKSLIPLKVLTLQQGLRYA